MKIILLFTGLTFFLLPHLSFCQNVGIGTTAPHTSAELDISSTARGLLIPRMTSTGITAIGSPAKGLMVYDSLNNQLMVNMGSPALPNWQTIVAGSGWSLTGNSGINPASQFIGNKDNQPLRFRVNNTQAGELNPSGNVFWGLRAGQANASAYSNIAIGTDALKLNTFRGNLVAIGDSALFNNATVTGYDYGGENTAIGSKSLFSNTNGYGNTATGFQSLYYNAGGSTNTANGSYALYQNTSGYNNTANGAYALENNSTATDNTANGVFALYANSSGGYNTAEGSQALYYNSTGSENTVAGYKAMEFSTTGNNNTATGVGTLSHNSAGSDNTAIGHSALYTNSGSLGSYNTAVGSYALVGTPNSQYNTAIGYNAGSTYEMGYNNTILGANCGIGAPGLYNCIAIGQDVTCTSNSQARIGNLATNSIGGTVGWSTLSDGRYKMDMQENVKGIDFIMKLRPLTYHLNLTALNNKLNGMTAGRKNNIQDTATRQALAQKESVRFSGFVAQEVEEAAKASGYAFSGVDKPQNENDFYGLRYAEFVVPLVKAVQEQQQMIIDLQKQINELKAMVKNK
jgi:hypothetical protein